MADLFPVIIVGATIGVLSLIFFVAYMYVRSKKLDDDYERKMTDGELIKRLLGYAKPYLKEFVIVFLVMLLSIVYDLLSPVLIGDIIERQFKSAGNPNLGAALSLVLMLLVFVCTGIMNRFGSDEEGGVVV